MTTPTGNNQLNALGIFKQRKFYTEEVYPEDLAPEPIDLWYEKQNYGKVDEVGDSVFPSESFLKQLRSRKDVFVLDFVADAFEDFRIFLQSALARQNLAEGSIFSNIEPTQGWASSNEAYFNYVKTMYDSFSETFIIQNGLENQLTDFESFLKLFTKFIDQITPHFSLTRTSFLQTKHCSPMVSGLMVEVKTQKHDDDRTKFDQFLQDRNFIFYARAARRYGFMVDKNAPWRLVADINSPAMVPYLERNNIATGTLFEKQFYKAHRLDLDIIKTYILQFYNSFAIANPVVKEVKSKGDSVVFSRQERKTLTMEELDEIYDDAFWLRLYAFMRAKEVNQQFNQVQFENFIRTITQASEIFDRNRVLDFINERLEKCPSFMLDTNLEVLHNSGDTFRPRKKRRNFNLFL